MELNRKLVTIILVALIIIVPIVTVSYTVWGPARLDKIWIEAVTPHDDRDGVRVVASASGGGQTFDGDVDLVILYEGDEQVYTGRLTYREGVANEKLLLEDFAVGNGDYEFRISHEGLSDRYYFQLDMVVEELEVLISNVAYNPDKKPPDVQYWEALYYYFINFKTGWHFYDWTIDVGDFYYIAMGSKVEGDTFPIRVETNPEAGCRVKVYYEDETGKQPDTPPFDRSVEAGSILTETFTVQKNATYWYNVINEMTVPIKVSIYENKQVSIKEDQKLEFDLDLEGTQLQEEEQLLGKVENVEGYIRPKRGPGWYNVTISFTNEHIQTGAPYETVSVVKNILLNDIPKADPSAGSYVLGSRPTERDVTFDATASVDDGPMEDLTVTWFFGAYWDGDTLTEIDSVEGPWEQYKTYTFVYPLGQNPDLSDGRPYLLLEDAYGVQSEIAYINMEIR